MAAKKLLRLVSGRIKEIVGIVVSAGAANDGDIAVLDAAGKFDASLMPTGFGQNTVTGIASEALAVNDLVNIFNNAGAVGVRKADASVEGKEANGFVKSTIAAAGSATVYTSGNVITGLTGLTIGARQFLTVVAGTRGETPPSAAGNVVQIIGIAASATSIVFEPEEPITVA